MLLEDLSNPVCRNPFFQANLVLQELLQWKRVLITLIQLANFWEATERKELQSTYFLLDTIQFKKLTSTLSMLF